MMVFKKCPGQDLSRKKPEDVVYNLPCPHCGYEVEFFFDDKFRICSRCKTNIKKSDKRLLKDFGCASWCIAAEECLGPKLYARFNEAKKLRSSASKHKTRKTASSSASKR